MSAPFLSNALYQREDESVPSLTYSDPQEIKPGKRKRIAEEEKEDTEKEPTQSSVEEQEEGEEPSMKRQRRFKVDNSQ